MSGNETMGAAIMAMTDALARCSEAGPGVSRHFLTPEHKQAAALIRGWMDDAGMETHMDAIGNVVGRYRGDGSIGRCLITGSHQDTVRQGGRYDGMLGIVTPIVCIAALNRQGRRLPFDIEVIAFGDEEGVRFGTTLLGSHAVAGNFDPGVLDKCDRAGVSIAEALERFGLDPAGIPAAARRAEDVLAYVELHIEQGPVLEAEGLPVGVVTAIAGATRSLVRFTGMAGHAGTVPMTARRDALAGAAEAILAVERLCAEGRDLVGTVGIVEASPGAANVIPGGASFSLDVRAPGDADRDRVLAVIREEFETICARRGLSLEIEDVYDEPAVTCAPWLVEAGRDAIAGEGIRPLSLFSGAGHDAVALSAICDVGMLFVRCKGGISHNPAEAITEADADTGARVFLRYLERIAERSA